MRSPCPCPAVSASSENGIARAGSMRANRVAGVRRVEVRRDLDRPQRRIGDAPQRIAHLPCLDHVMQVVGGVPQQRTTRRTVAIQDLQRLDQRRAGGHRRRRSEDRQATVAPGHRRPLDHLVLREILEADDAAVGFHVGRDAFGDAAAIERLGAFGRDRPQRRGVVRVREPLAGPRHAAVRQVDPRRFRVALEQLRVLRATSRAAPRRVRSRRRRGQWPAPSVASS